jgi:CRISPR/Cas system-associated exonuclease Cas4 (RecB family)
MIEVIVFFLIALGAVAFLYKWARNTFGKSKLGIDGKLIWTDKGRHTKPFFNARYEVLGKPDLMYRISKGILAVEYKSRKGPIFKSDVAQAKCSALAARGEGYKVVRLLLKTATQEEYIDLPSSDAALYEDIKEDIVTVRHARNGKPMPAKPALHKCRNCAYKNDCKNAAL